MAGSLPLLLDSSRLLDCLAITFARTSQSGYPTILLWSHEPGSNQRVEDLQSPALPLGYRGEIKMVPAEGLEPPKVRGPADLQSALVAA